ncbi:MAG: helix-turn-helix domain-containing protein [Muribaculaceae bacterium]|nr:helix-turn-helix domain-containing protein [Muribaculaceae bacterium]
MNLGLKYDNIQLPQKVSDMLEQDFWIINNVSPLMVKAITSPVKFSAYTSIFVSKGSCSADINLIKYKITAPAIVNISSSHIMQPYDISEDFCASFVVMSARMRDAIVSHIADLSLISRIAHTPVTLLNDETCGPVAELYANLMSISADTSIEHPFHTILYTLLAFFYRWGKTCYNHPKGYSHPHFANHTVEKFLRLVQENFRKERFLDYYADRLELTPKHLSRIIKQHTGFTAVEWINRYIILEAKVMLSSTNMNVQQIAEELNFPSQSFFGKYFKKATGVSPKDFRNA